ncbi:Bacteriophage CI repressor helix-turn-helix domain [Yersinia frederiksenii]|uniref:helix-turn-helix domain-containing protein n=1 Tax=Yersinia frederiksenii TaxID=29484 RepID=UPI0005DD0D18|nr:helix-turn-helix domain-containing protein [Yersinia frederiksenii]CFQ99358.1 Bacteriophage CI repressor helix-turn-helix domain [Yersinia frederiksenii]
MTQKENAFAIPLEGKESFSSRLQKLIGNRSVRAAAKDWGLPTSTINNYLHKGTEPAFKMVLAIAKAEGVSLEWLASGSNETHEELNKNHQVQQSTPEMVDPLRYAWMMVYESLNADEAGALLRVIHKKGVDGIVELATANSLDIELLQLPTEEKERLMALHEAKKGASESGVENTSGGQSQKRVG